MKSGDAEGARQCFDRALEILDAAYGPTCPQTATVLADIGDLLRFSSQDLDGARLRYLKALVILETAYGLEHPGVVDVMISIGSVLVAQKHRIHAEIWFERAAAVSRALDNSEDVNLIIPFLFRLGQSGSTWMNPKAYKRKFDQALVRMCGHDNPDSSLAIEAQHYQDNQEGRMRAHRRLGCLIPALFGFCWFLAAIANRVLWVTKSYQVLPVLAYCLIAVDVGLFVASCTLGWMYWRGRHGQPPFLKASESYELKEFTELRKERQGYAASWTFQRCDRQGDTFARLARADTYLMLGWYDRAVEIFNRILELQPDQASVLRRRALANLNLANRGPNKLDGAHKATAALADLDHAIALQPDSRFAQLLRSRALEAVGR